MSQVQRLNDRLIAHWDLLRKDQPMPEFAKFNVGPVEDLWKQCVLFLVLPSAPDKPPTVNFYQVGESLRSLYGGNDMTGKSAVTTQRNFEGAAIIRRIAELMANPSPLKDEGQFMNSASKLVKYRSCLLPFGKDGKITHIVAGLSWREF